jgi:hypothetical protein
MKPKNRKKKNVLKVSHRLVLKLGVSLFYSKDAFNDWVCLFFLLKSCFHLLSPCFLLNFNYLCMRMRPCILLLHVHDVLLCVKLIGALCV